MQTKGVRHVEQLRRLTAYQEGIAQRMQMAAEDGKKLAEGTQKIVTTIAKSLPNGRGAKA